MPVQAMGILRKFNATTPLDPLVGAVLPIAAAILLSGCVADRSTQPVQTQVHLKTDEAREYYASLEEQLTEGGFLKTNGGADAGFSAKNLMENFERIALYDEFQLSGNKLVRSSRETRIRRWEDPIRVSINFGRSFPDRLRTDDTAFIVDYLDRIRNATGHRIEVVQDRANFHIFVMNSEEISGIGARLAKLNVPRSRLIGEQITFRPVESLCSVFAITESGQDSRYLAAVVVVKPKFGRRSSASL